MEPFRERPVFKSHGQLPPTECNEQRPNKKRDAYNTPPRTSRESSPMHGASLERLQCWRHAPEELNEAEKDELQREIQLAYLTFASQKATDGDDEGSSGEDGGCDVDEELFDG